MGKKRPGTSAGSVVIQIFRFLRTGTTPRQEAGSGSGCRAEKAQGVHGSKKGFVLYGF